MSLCSDLKEVLTPYAQRIKGLAAADEEIKADLGDVEDKTINAFAVDSASGAVASFTDGADDIPLKSLVVNIEPVQGGSGDPSPTNIRPITGWTGATVKQTGKNLTNMFSDGKIPSVSNGQLVTGKGLRSDYISMDGDTQITFSGNTSSTIYCFFYDSGKNLISFNANTSPMSVTTPSNTAYVMLRTESSATSLQLELGSTATTYEPYNGTTFSVDWTDEAGTVYGGTLDVTTGVLTVTHGIVDLGTFTFSYSDVYNRFLSTRYLEASKKPATNNIAIDGCVCSAYKITSSNKTADSTYDKNLGISMDGRIDIRNTDYTEVDAFSESLDSVMFVYPLATPVTYQLTAQEVKTLLGANNVYADTGDVNVEYRADPTLYVDRKISDFAVMPMIAPTEVGYTATQNYTTGALLIVNNTLYKVTSNIANGGAITPNTNVVATTLSEIISALA